ncbi:MAG: protein kinase [Acidobacteria bacterium]|nr:protein kinase [Acidobacteriota bacterium]
MMDFKLGDTVGDYEIVSVLGAGGMGRVYKVRNILSDRLEAMKVLLPHLLEAPEQAERFLREIRLQASLDHANIAALRTALRHGDQMVMVMELVDGTALQSLLGGRPLPVQEAISYMVQVLAALSYAHGRGVIHRDIKPANIMVTHKGMIKLTDFGLAKLLHDRKLTATGATMGSLYYMSPEQVKGDTDVDTRSDLYSLGVTFYEAVAGQRPFQGETDYAVMSAHLNQSPVPPVDLNPGIPPELNRIILKALAKEPSERFQSADEFLTAIQGVPGYAEEQAVEKTLAVSSVSAPKPAPEVLSRPTTPGSVAPAPSTSANMEMAFVLFMDLVSYSTLHMDRQSQRIQQLQEVVRNTKEFQRAQESGQLISLPTGDGMALVFFQNPVAPVQCATEISRALQSYPELKLRMGVHTGPVYRIADINANWNVAGGGINLAQRVMDCGDAGHILVSKTVADILSQLSDWSDHLHDFGEHEVKHGVKVQLVNFCTGAVGNPNLPQKISQKLPVITATPPPPVSHLLPAAASNRKLYWLGGGLAAVAIVVFGVLQFARRNTVPESRIPAPPAAVTPAEPSASAPPPPPTPTGTTTPAPPSGSTPMPATAAAFPQQLPVDVAPQASDQEAPRQPSPPAAVVPPQNRTESQPVQQPPATTAATTPAQASPSSVDRALLQELRERMIFLAARASAVRGSVETLENQQRQAGLSLRVDMAAAKQSVEYLMGEADASLAAGDAATAKRNLDLAEQNVEKLERFLGL